MIYNIFSKNEFQNLDLNRDQSVWESVRSLEISNFMGKVPNFQPKTKVGLFYSSENLYVNFRVYDCFVRCVETEINGKIWEDSCVEFFFAPEPDFPERYFNLEINCGATALMHYNTVARKEFKIVSVEEINQIEIISSLPKIVQFEIKTPIVWTISCKIPFRILKNYGNFETPKKGTKWHANFHKTASNNSNPHHITWAKIASEKPDFHLPQFFGTLKFC